MDEDTVSLVDDISEEAPPKMVPAERVNDIVKKRLSANSEKIRREMQELHAQELEKLRAFQANSSANMESSSPQMQELIAQQVAQELAKLQEQERDRLRQIEIQRDEQEIEEAVQNFHMKIADGKEKIPELDESLKNFDMNAFGGVALLAGKMDNTADIMVELSKNPIKAEEILRLGKVSRMSAMRKMQELSDSISKNKEALENNIQTKQPLSRLKSSPVGADAGIPSVNDYRDAAWLKF